MIYTIRKIILSLVSLIISTWAFGKNNLGGKIGIFPFLIGSFALLNESIFLLLNKKRIAKGFKYIFRISLFFYIFGFLLYVIYYTVVNKEYSLLIPLAIFLLFIIPVFKNSFPSRKEKYETRSR